MAKAESSGRWWPVHPTAPLSWYLVAIISIATVPLAIFAAYLILQQTRAAQTELERTLRSAASALALTVERDLATTTEVLQAFGDPDAAHLGDKAAIDRELTRLLGRRADWIGAFILDADGDVIVARGDDRALAMVNAARVRGVRFQQGSPRGAFQLIRQRVAGTDLTAVAVQVTSVKAMRWTVGAVFQPDKWQLLIDRQAQTVPGFSGIFDREGDWIAHAARTAGASSGPAAELFRDVADPSRTQGMRRVERPGAASAYVAWNGIGATGWGAAVGIAADPVDRERRNSILAAIVGGALAFAIGLLCALAVGRGVTSPLARLAQGASPPRGNGTRAAVTEVERLTQALEIATAERDRDRAALQRKADELETLFRHTPVGLALAADRECRNVMGNTALGELLGIGADGDFSLQSAATHTHPLKFYAGGRELAVEDLPLRRAARYGEQAQGFEFTVVRPDGRTVQLLGYAAPLRSDDGAPRGAVAAFIDVTERVRKDQHLRETQARLEASERRVELAQEVGGVGFFDHDFTHDVSVWTSGMARLFGLEPGAFAGNWAAWAELAEPDDAVKIRADIDAAIAARAPTVTFEYRARHRDGTTRVLANRALLLYDAERRAQRMVGVALDITEQHMTEQERSTLLAREQQARQEAETANRSKDEFLAIFSHELRNPLSAIAAATEVLNRIGRQQPDEIRARDVIKRQVHNLTRMMEDLLDVTRVVNGKVTLSRAPLDLAAAVQRAASALSVTGRLKDHRLELDLAPAWISGDSVRIEQIATNLLTNAARYTPPGGTISVKVGIDRGDALLAVTDTGMGIPPDMLERVFDLFVQAERGGGRRHGGGLGVGLTLVRRLAELHGGTVVAFSEGTDRGSRFEVRFPRIDQPARF